MDREGLLGDLKALHHGRGLRRAGVRGWLGPALLEALGATPQHSDAELGTKLRPGARRAPYGVASGIVRGGSYAHLHADLAGPSPARGALDEGSATRVLRGP